MWYRTLLTIPSQGQKLLASTSGADHDAEVCKNRFTQTSGNRRGAAPTITQKVTLLTLQVATPEQTGSAAAKCSNWADLGLTLTDPNPRA